MPESQQHGFTWEAEIKTKVFGVTEATSYTAVHDVDLGHETISIKTTGSGTLCMGDPLRILDYEPGIAHTCLVVQYVQREGHKDVTCIYEMDLNERERLWGQVTRQDVEELTALIRSMPPDRRDPELDRAIVARKKELNAKSGILRFNPKIDGHGQRRLQCSIPGFAKHCTSASPGAIVRGVPITASLVSPRRIRKNTK